MWTHRRTSVRKHVTWRISEALYLYGAAQVDACFNGHIVGSLKEGPLQEQSEEEQHGQHICILQKLLGGNEIDPQQPHLEAQTGRKGGGQMEISTSFSVSQAGIFTRSITEDELCRTGFDFGEYEFQLKLKHGDSY